MTNQAEQLIPKKKDTTGTVERQIKREHAAAAQQADRGVCCAIRITVPGDSKL
jgi:hypothetical protein